MIFTLKSVHITGYNCGTWLSRLLLCNLSAHAWLMACGSGYSDLLQCGT